MRNVCQTLFLALGSLTWGCGGPPPPDSAEATAASPARPIAAPHAEAPTLASASSPSATAKPPGPEASADNKLSVETLLARSQNYADGTGVAKDQSKALEYLREAAARGDEPGVPRAEYLLGVSYELAQGVPKDEAAAFSWYLKAANHGNVDAQFQLGLYYNGGRGVAEDDAKAVGWYQSAVQQGHAGAMNNLGWLYMDGVGTTRDEKEAVRLFREAARLGLKTASGSLAFAYDYGAGGLTPDGQQAFELYEKHGGEWAMKRRVRLQKRLKCETGADTLLFDVKLKCADRNQLRFRIRAAGGGVTRENLDDWGDSYETSKLLSGSSSLHVAYTYDNWFAVAEYEFSGDAFEAVGDRMISKYGKPRSTHGNLEVGPASASWLTKDGIEIELHHGWPATETFLTYKHPAAFRQLKTEQAKLKRKKEGELYRSESRAF